MNSLLLRGYIFEQDNAFFGFDTVLIVFFVVLTGNPTKYSFNLCHLFVWLSCCPAFSFQITKCFKGVVLEPMFF